MGPVAARKALSQSVVAAVAAAVGKGFVAAAAAAACHDSKGHRSSTDR